MAFDGISLSKAAGSLFLRAYVTFIANCLQRLLYFHEKSLLCITKHFQKHAWVV